MWIVLEQHTSFNGELTENLENYYQLTKCLQARTVKDKTKK